MLGHEGRLAATAWPQADPRYLKKEEIEIVVQVNGKLRDCILAPPDFPEDQLIEQAKSRDKIQPFLSGVKIIKVVTVPNRLVNFVVRPSG